jgi:hypothetical protein
MYKLLCLAVVLSLSSFVNIKRHYSSHAGVPFINSNDSTLASTLNAAAIEQLYTEIDLGSYNLPFDVFQKAIAGYTLLRSDGKLGDKNILTIIDFTKPSTEKRFYTIDLDTKQVAFHSLVAHGRNTGENIAKSFSNKQHSNQSSLGFYVTGESYVGSKGYSLRLDGQEKEYNGNLRSRAVVIHSADYVSDAWIKKYGRIGRSQGCPALPNEINKAVIDVIKDKTVVFAYFNDSNYLENSVYLDAFRKIAPVETIAAGQKAVSGSIKTAE